MCFDVLKEGTKENFKNIITDNINSDINQNTIERHVSFYTRQKKKVHLWTNKIVVNNF